MDSKEIIFTRKWTDFGWVQPGMTCHYALTVESSAGGTCGVAVGEEGTWRGTKFRFHSLRAALRLLRFLYENGVTPDMVSGIEEDLQASHLLEQWDEEVRV